MFFYLCSSLEKRLLITFGDEEKAGLLEDDGLGVSINGEALEKWGELVGDLPG